MKAILALLFLVIIIGCNKPESNSSTKATTIRAAEPNTDTSGYYKAVASLCDTHLKAAMDFDTITLAKILDDHALYIGTDPTEIWGKAQIVTYFHQVAVKKHSPLEISLVDRNIFFTDREHAIVTEHVINKSISKNMATRINYHTNYTNGSWTFDYVCWSLAPKNECLKQIDGALNK